MENKTTWKENRPIACLVLVLAVLVGVLGIGTAKVRGVAGTALDYYNQNMAADFTARETAAQTILGIAGVDVGDKMIGEDFANVLHKTDPDRPNEVFAQISESRVGRAIRTADYAYSVYAPGINGGAQPAADLYADDFFYDLKKDPYELNNLIDDPAYTQVKQELRKKLLKWIRLAENAEPEIVDG